MRSRRERKRTERERPVVGPLIPFIDAILEADRKSPRKQRHTAHRIWRGFWRSGRSGKWRK